MILDILKKFWKNVYSIGVTNGAPVNIQVKMAITDTMKQVFASVFDQTLVQLAYKKRKCSRYCDQLQLFITKPKIATIQLDSDVMLKRK